MWWKPQIFELCKLYASKLAMWGWELHIGCFEHKDQLSIVHAILSVQLHSSATPAESSAAASPASAPKDSRLLRGPWPHAVPARGETG